MSRILAILAAHDAGGQPKDIAATLGIDVRTVKGALERYGPEDARAEAARNLLTSNALQSVQDWIHASKRGAELGKHQAAKELLLHAKVIEPLEDKQQGPGVQIIIGMAGQPAGPDPLAGAKVVSEIMATKPEVS